MNEKQTQMLIDYINNNQKQQEQLLKILRCMSDEFYKVNKKLNYLIKKDDPQRYK